MIGLTEEHQALAASVRGFAERHITAQAVRQSGPPAFWTALADQGLLGLHLPEEYGGQGYGLLEQAIALEELGRALAPGPYLPTVLASAVINTYGTKTARAELLPALADGSRTAAVALSGEFSRTNGAVTGVAETVLAADLADLLLVPLGNVPSRSAAPDSPAPGGGLSGGDTSSGEAPGGVSGGAVQGSGVSGDDVSSGMTSGVVTGGGPGDAVRGGGVSGGAAPGAGAQGGGWVRFAVVRAGEATVEVVESLDLGRSVARVELSGVPVPDDLVIEGPVHELATLFLAAEACGVAGRALDEAVAYAKVREQFGRPIGQFQGVKHKCARMLIAVERARAAEWDAARAIDGGDGERERAYAVGVAGALAPDAAVTCAEGNIQVHGGIGYTFEHDAHLAYRRALTLRAFAGRAARHRADVARLAQSGLRPSMDIELPEGSAALREEIRAQAAELAAMDLPAQRAAMAEGGWVTPHLPKPWGRAAGPVEQVVIQQELKRANVRPVPLMIAAWVVPSLVQYGTREQQERFLPRTLRGEIVWCQLFSEPGAGSDLAGLSTRAERVEGGWRITGQKIWTSLAREAQWGICLARTDPAAPKHDGITYFLVDMASDGIEIRPLRECTGDAVFNEVFLDGVFVPDELVVGEPGQGWRVARNTLANERVGLTSSFQLGADLPKLVELAAELGSADDPLVVDDIGRLAADEHAFRLLGLRATLKQLSGTDPGATANVRKLVAMEHGQQVTEYGFTLLGEEGALTGPWKSGLRRRWTRHLLASRAMTIGGGTTEINLNVIAERILGLPRDP